MGGYLFYVVIFFPDDGFSVLFFFLFNDEVPEIKINGFIETGTSFYFFSIMDG